MSEERSVAPVCEENSVMVYSKPEFVTGSNNIKQKIMDEEAYLSVLDKIVERDFYPELTKLKLTAAYIDALNSNDVERLRDIQIQLEKETPNISSMLRVATPRDFDAPITSEETHEPGDESGSQVSNSLTLDKFLMKNTSEDNASFEKIMEATREKHREKHAWLHEKQAELHQRLDASRALPSSAQEQFLALETKPSNLDTWKYVSKNALMYTPEGVELTPDEYIQSKGKKEKEIRHENTRFKTDPFDNQASQTAMSKASQEQATLKKVMGKVGVDGKLEDASGETPDVRGYKFVPEPSPAPGVDASPLMTWGEIEGTPMRLDATPAPNFRIQDPPRREQLAHSLVEKASKQHREKRKKAFAAASASIFSPKHTPKSNALTLDRVSLLSPAAQKLMKSSVRVNTDKSLRASYTPSPLVRNGITTPSSMGVKTPASQRKDSSWSTPQGSSITDNLLELPNT